MILLFYVSRLTCLVSNQNTLITVGIAERDKPKPVMTIMERNWYMGSWRFGSVLVTFRIMIFPRSDTTQMKVNGRKPDADSFQPWDAQKDKCD